MATLNSACMALPRRARMRTAFVPCLVLLACVGISKSRACPPQQAAKLTVANGASDRFGFPEVNGDTIVVCAPLESHSGLGTPGAVYVYVRSGTVRGVCTLQARLTEPQPGENYQYATSAAISGDTLLVGSVGANQNGTYSGAVYVYTRSGGIWALQSTLTASDAEAGDTFGSSIAISGDTALIGAYNDSHSSVSNAGSVYVFTRDAGQWSEDDKLIASDPHSGDYFGASVALHGGTAIIGAQGHDLAGNSAGAAYVFERAGGTGGAWSEEIRLTASDADEQTYFGRSVAALDDVVLIGSPYAEVGGQPARGAVYQYTRVAGSWGQEVKLTAPIPGNVITFGSSLAVDGDRLLVGGNGLVGAAPLLFERSGATWTALDTLTAPDATSLDDYGSWVALSGDTAVVAAPYQDRQNAEDTGAVYVFDLMPTLSEQITASDAASGDTFGGAVAIDGETVVVTATLTDHGAQNAGTAYVYTRGPGQWVQQARLVAQDPMVNGTFGISVAISGDTLVVGSGGDPQGVGGAGSAYVFVRSGSAWTQQAKLTASDLSLNATFGSSVAIDGDTILIGAPQALNAIGLMTGAAYVFVRENGAWTQHTKLAPAGDARFLDAFGHAVALDGDTAFVAIPADDFDDPQDPFDPGDHGSVEVFQRTGGVGGTWSPHSLLVAPDAQPNAYFGHAVALDEDTAVISARRAGNPGAAYVFIRSSGAWTHQVKLIDPTAMTNDYFGNSVDIDGDRIVVGEWRDDHFNAIDAGAAFVFEREGGLGGIWQQRAQLAAPHNGDHSFFGWAVAVSGDLAIIGTYYDDLPGGLDAGAAYLFDVAPVAPSAPTLQDWAACNATPTQISVTPTGSGPFTYQWRRNSQSLSDGPTGLGSTIVGASTATLSIDDVTVFDAGSYDCIVSNTCDSVASNVASLSIIGALPGDTNQDGLRNGKDIQGFLDILIQGGAPSAAYCAADMNLDGAVSTLDVPLLVSVLLGP